ncbi:MAG TPA: GNAT family N-acetyltransferase [Oscillatoriales cyanobacterium M59_W2019_021]|nr:MAG: N-acetyltransferase [Cyanobacteria bacterium J055]HIK31607.1 GNAT family N-acetyltransferase [Oscillatoriales cyanobacterium M4454_W2019_049]HIK49444.1 GNAT family N-acetyltransferase [Oscillatoriales cyanobacterium M59_W2019_021]
MTISVPLQTSRLVIRRFIPPDLPAYLDFMLDPESTRYLAFSEEQKTEKGATDLFDFVISAYDSENIIPAYVIALADSNEYIGSCGFSPYEPQVVECYYSINSPYRRRGYALEAMTALFDALRSSGEIDEIRAYCHEDNIASLNLAKKLGMDDRGIATHAHSGLTGRVYIASLNSL